MVTLLQQPAQYVEPTLFGCMLYNDLVLPETGANPLPEQFTVLQKMCDCQVFM